jgi:signal transduction histidine kinase
LDSRQLEERRRTDEIRRDFVASVSHELKTPATGLNLLAESLLQTLEDDPEQARQFALQIRDETERMGRLVNDLLDLARLESEEGIPEPEPVDVRSVLVSVLSGIRQKARSDSVSLKWKRYGSTELYTVEGDETQLTSMFTNLVENAVKYTPPGGSVEVTGEVDESGVTVSVNDTGLGIPEEHLPRIFERFYRVDRARSKKSGGTGLGLSIVKHVAEKHGGTIYVESTPHEGSTFTVCLPCP